MCNCSNKRRPACKNFPAPLLRNKRSKTNCAPHSTIIRCTDDQKAKDKMPLCSLLFAASMSPCFYRVLGCEYCCDNRAGTDSMVMVSVMLSYIVTSDSMGTLQKRLSLCRRTLIKLSPPWPFRICHNYCFRPFAAQMLMQLMTCFFTMLMVAKR